MAGLSDIRERVCLFSAGEPLVLPDWVEVHTSWVAEKKTWKVVYANHKTERHYGCLLNLGAARDSVDMTVRYLKHKKMRNELLVSLGREPTEEEEDLAAESLLASNSPDSYLLPES